MTQGEERLKYPSRLGQTYGRGTQAHVTQQDLVDLENEIKDLIDEREELRAKIARLEIQSKRAARTSSTKTRLLSKFDREYKELEAGIMRQRAIINEQLMSDSAALRQELQEECLILYEETLRLRDEQITAQMELSDARIEFRTLMEEDGPNILPNLDEAIADAEQKLHKVQTANLKLSAVNKKLKAQRKIRTEADGGDYTEMIRELKSKIHTVEKQTSDVENRIKELTDRHREVMKSFHLNVLSSPLR